MIRILTDSASDLLPAEAEALGVTVIPLNVTFEDGEVIRDGIDLTAKEYYTRLAACKKLPKTSQPSPELFEAYFRQAAEAGDTVVGIFLSSALSGTYQCARLAADLAGFEDVYFVDSLTVTVAEAMLVRLAVELRDAGKTAIEITAAVEEAKQHLHLVAVIDDLTYLRKGGRLPAAAAIAGGMLGIKPLIAVRDGKVAVIGKARGLPGAYVALCKKIDELGGLTAEQRCMAGYTTSIKEVEPIQAWLDKQHLPAAPVGNIGCVIGTHAGPGAFGFAFFDAEAKFE